MESSLSILRGARVARLGAANCVSVAPGVESWSAYSEKAGVAGATGGRKLFRVVEHFAALHEHVPYLQANFMFGLDDDRGDEPVELLTEFERRTPWVWPVVNIPHPFGGTALFTRWRAEGRILTAMPFSFYYSPYLVSTLRHYTPIAYYERLIEIFTALTSPAMLVRRLRTTSSAFVRAAHLLRTAVKRRRIGAFGQLLGRLRSDRQFRAFHEGESAVLPEFYHREYEQMLGPYAPLLSRADRIPVLG